MLYELEEYLSQNKFVKIIKTKGETLVGEFYFMNKCIASELFNNSATCQFFDSPEIIISLNLKQKYPISYRDIARFEPIDNLE